MKRRSIAGKLFVLTAGFFAVFILLEAVFLNFFINEFYIYRKIETASSSINAYAANYSSSQWSFRQAGEEVERLSELINASVTVINEDGMPVQGSRSGMYSRMTVQDAEGRYYQVLLDYLRENPAFRDFQPAAGDQLYIEGISYEAEPSSVEPYSIQDVDTVYEDKSMLDQYRDPESGVLDEGANIVKISGIVVYVQETVGNLNYASLDPELYRQDLLARHILEWMQGSFRQAGIRAQLAGGTVFQEDFTDPISGVKYVFLAKEMKTAYAPHYVCAVVSLQPIDEVMGVIRDYYLYYLLLAAIFVILLSFFFSRMVARPLIEMNAVAGRMANLDFGAVSQVDSRDELGQLSDSLNSLSRNLNQSMNELKTLNEQLYSDIEKEREQEEKRREFVASVSHEFKTPLGIIRSYAEGIKDGIYKEKREHYLEVIIDETEKMDALVLEMLELSHLESANMKLNQSEFSLDELIEECRAKFAELAAQHQMSFAFEPGQHIVYADRRRIEQVLTNLFSNAVRYSDPGTLIGVRLTRREGFIYTLIENGGAHIDETEMPRIWERFYRVDKSRSRALGGTGLGLLIVRNIMEMHHCDFGVSNTERGVEFYFALLESV